MTTLFQKIVAGVMLVLILLVVALSFWVLHERRKVHQAGITADTLAATLDTNRTHILSPVDSTRLLGDSIRIVQRRAIQKAQQADALDKALKLERKAKIDLQARVDSLVALRVVGTSVRVDSSGVRTATFHVDSTPFHIDADVRLPPPPAPGILDRLKIVVDPIAITARMHCGSRNELGVSPAQLTLTGPAWATLAIVRTEQDVALCENEKPPPAFWKRFLSSCGIGPSYSIIVTQAIPPRIAQGLGVAASCRVFP